MRQPRLIRSGLLLAVLVSAVELGAQTTANDYNTLGVQAREKGDFAKAMADYTKAIELNPKFAEAYSNRGGIKRIVGDFTGAITDLTKAIELNPAHAAAYNNRGAIKRSKGDFTGAIADFTKAIELKPDFASAYNNRGLAKRFDGDLDGAIADFTKAIALDPQHRIGIINLATAEKLKKGGVPERLSADELEERSAADNQRLVGAGEPNDRPLRGSNPRNP